LRSKGDDPHEVPVAQLAGDRTEDAGSARGPRVVDQHRGVLVEGDVGAVAPAELLARAHHDGLDDLALADAAVWGRLLDGGGDGVADPRVAAVGSALDADAEDLARAGVVGDLEPGLLLDHLAFSRISTKRQRLVLDSGRVSTIRTRSPSPASFCASWACR